MYGKPKIIKQNNIKTLTTCKDNNIYLKNDFLTNNVTLPKLTNIISNFVPRKLGHETEDKKFMLQGFWLDYST